VIAPLVLALATAAPQGPGAGEPIASYVIDAALDPDRHRIDGTLRLTWRNATAHATDELPLHLYWNAWRNDHSSFLRAGERWSGDLAEIRDDAWARIDVTSAALIEPAAAELLAGAQHVSRDDGNPHDRTVLVLALPRAVAPGEQVVLELGWEAIVPRTFARTGRRGDYYFVAQWFPKVGVLEDGGAWNCHQFIQTEFFADYGDYDVTLRTPSGWVVGATGREIESTDGGDGTTSHRFVQSDVHDFAWTTSPDYRVLERRFEDEVVPGVDMRLLLMPDHDGIEDAYFAGTEAALRWYGRWYGEYPYGHVTIVDPAWGSGAGGMEYPTLFTGGAHWLVADGERVPHSVTVHECGHQFWYGLVGNDEFTHAWLDEGFNTYAQSRVLAQEFPRKLHVERYLDGFVPVAFDDIPLGDRADGADRYGTGTSALERDAQAMPSWRTGPGAYRVNAYDKGALTLRTLENLLGTETMHAVLRTYFARWRFRHPTPADFFAVAEEVSGRELDWFFEQTWAQALLFDYAVGEVSSRAIAAPRGWVDGELATAGGDADAGEHESIVHVRRWGEGVFPVDVEIEFEDGEVVRERWDGRERWTRFQYVRGSPVERVRVDPERVLVLDVDSANNGWMRRSRAHIAATKWSSKWMVWAQNLLEAFAVFA
jgi:hypothetical protein